MYCATGTPLQFVTFDASGKCPTGSAVLMSQAEYDAVTVASTLNEVFKLPAAEELRAAFAAGFIIPATLSLVAWSCASLVNFWRK